MSYVHDFQRREIGMSRWRNEISISAVTSKRYFVDHTLPTISTSAEFNSKRDAAFPARTSLSIVLIIRHFWYARDIANKMTSIPDIPQRALLFDTRPVIAK